jgi:mycothiol synthase
VVERIETVARLGGARKRAVDALIGEATAADGVPPVGEHKYLKLHAGSPVCVALLAYEGQRLDGYAQVLRSAHDAVAEIVVRPSARRRGIGRRLVTAARDLAGAGGAQALKLWAYGGLPASTAIASGRGLSVSRTLLQLERGLGELPATPSTDGFTIRTFDVSRDREPWLHLHNAVFADHPENGTWSAHDLEVRLGQPWFDANDFLIAESHGRMVGFNWLKRLPIDGPVSEGEIYIIGVADSERGRGLGRSLALLGLHHLRRREVDVCTLYVEGDNEPALGLYRRLGFQVRHAHHCYTLPLVTEGVASAAAPAQATTDAALAPCT